MLVHLDARQRHQVVDQARHARRLVLHDLEEALARRRVLVGRAAQGLDEADQRRERRAQLVADIGDEIGAHAVDALDHGQVLERDDRGRAVGQRLGQGLDARAQDALDRRRQGELDVARGAVLERAFGGVEHRRVAQERGEAAADRRAAEQVARREIGADHLMAAVDQHDRLGHVVEHGRLGLRARFEPARAVGDGAAEPPGGAGEAGGEPADHGRRRVAAAAEIVDIALDRGEVGEAAAHQPGDADAGDRDAEDKRAERNLIEGEQQGEA